MILKGARVDRDEPTYVLDEVKYLIRERQCIATIGAKQSSHEIGFSETAIYDEILELEKKDFYKSVEGNRDRKFQDVYKKTIRKVPIYIKFKIVGNYADKVLVLSFKRDENVL